jgi:hypothetical protein
VQRFETIHGRLTAVARSLQTPVETAFVRGDFTRVTAYKISKTKVCLTILIWAEST